EKDIDVIYPTGDSFSVDILERASLDNIYAIGYVSDQSDIDKLNVLTSTVQHVERLYKFAAEQFNSKSLKGGILSFDFQEGAISLGEYSPEVPMEYQNLMNEFVETYIET